MKTDQISILCVSDIHFGHSDISQSDMADAFCETLFPVLKTVDICFINGDFFDTLVSFDNHEFDPIYDTILMMFHMCEKYKVKLRVLQGTWSHDRNQCKRFTTFYKNNHFTFDFKVVDTIELEEIPFNERALRFFYIPDDLPFKSSSDIVDVLKNKMVEKDWDYVDYGCMHGFFDFTFPRGVSQDNVIVFKESQFPFVKKAIDVGHVHQHRISGNVFSNGSFDRLCHGEEDLKGCILFKDTPQSYTAQFIENKLAAVYKTLTVPDEIDTETLSSFIDSQVGAIDSNRRVSIRFVVNSSEIYEAIKTWMKEKYPKVKITRKKSNDKSDTVAMLLSSTSFASTREKKIAPTRKTLSSFIRNHIPEENDITIERIEMHLESET